VTAIGNRAKVLAYTLFDGMIGYAINDGFSAAMPLALPIKKTAAPA